MNNWIILQKTKEAGLNNQRLDHFDPLALKGRENETKWEPEKLE
jgi:hypothetical protein